MEMAWLHASCHSIVNINYFIWSTVLLARNVLPVLIFVLFLYLLMVVISNIAFLLTLIFIRNFVNKCVQFLKPVFSNTIPLLTRLRVEHTSRFPACIYSRRSFGNIFERHYFLVGALCFWCYELFDLASNLDGI